MLLAVDASALVAEALRVRGRRLLNHPDLDLVIADRALDETYHELRQRIDRIGQRSDLGARQLEPFLEAASGTIAARVTSVPAESYSDQIPEASKRPRDSGDAPTVALALALDCGIWTQDRDFFGCGVPAWTTETLIAHLEL